MLVFIVITLVVFVITRLPDEPGFPTGGEEFNGTERSSDSAVTTGPGAPLAGTPSVVESVTLTTDPIPAGTNYPPSFFFSVTPETALAGRGETITYALDIIPDGDFQAPIGLELDVTALFFHQVYDLGMQYPPYPKRILYDFQVPAYVPPGTTLVGVIRAEGGGVVKDRGLVLTVR